MKTKVEFINIFHLHGTDSPRVEMLGPIQLKRMLSEHSDFDKEEFTDRIILSKSYPGENEHGEKSMDHGVTQQIIVWRN